ncbi:MAG: hypothetical protein IKO55_06785, partial [Kiritimatiellae bacterium]|nr:hypothetical protein [Kiritimatiellia bacterium]
TVVSAENEETAVAAVTVVVPAAVSSMLAPADYKAYFKLKATETGESGKFTVEVEDFADEVKTAVGTSALAGLLENQQSHQSSIAVKPGLYYGFSVGTNVDGLDSNPTCVLATGTTMDVDMPAYDTVAFIKVVIKASND